MGYSKVVGGRAEPGHDHRMRRDQLPVIAGPACPPARRHAGAMSRMSCAWCAAWPTTSDWLHEVDRHRSRLHDAAVRSRPRAHAVLAEVPTASRRSGIALYYYTFSTFTGAAGMFLEDLFVDPTHRGTGIGLALLRHLAQTRGGRELRRASSGGC